MKDKTKGYTMKKKDLYLGVDVGTSSLKLILINDDCQILKQDSEKYILDSPQVGFCNCRGEAVSRH